MKIKLKKKNKTLKILLILIIFLTNLCILDNASLAVETTRIY